MTRAIDRFAAGTSRLKRVLARRHLDGRVAEPTARLFRSLARLEGRAAVQAISARVLPPFGGLAALRLPTRRVDGEWRRWVVTTELDGPVDGIRHVLADVALGELRRAGLDPFLVDEDHGRLHFGLAASARQSALRALGGLDPADGWYLAWRRGSRRHVALLCRHWDRGRARRAESWELFRCRGLGPRRAVTQQGALLISFWAPGDTGRMERLGHRGLNRYEADTKATTEVIDGRRYPGLAIFPVARALTRFDAPVDVVYTWVDGADSGWRHNFDEWSRIAKPDLHGDHAVHPSRYASNDELRYSLRSLALNAGWVRHVYVLTAGQRPPWLREDDRLTVVHHEAVFPSSWLPTFNSHAIEARLHHIEGLAEHFVYVNDDVFLGRPLGVDAFFTANGLSKFFESAALVPPPSLDRHDLAVDTSARRGREILEREFGVVVGHKLQHAPFALRRSVLFDLEQQFAQDVERTAQHRFRGPDDLSIASGFAHHYGFCTGRAVPADLTVGYENLGGRRLKLFLRRLELGRDLDVFCINETERWQTDPAVATATLASFLETYFPVPSPWEAGPDARGR